MDSFQMSDLGSSKLNIEFNKLKEDFKNIIEEKTMLEKEIVKCRERISYQNNGENKLIQDNEKLKQQLNDKNRVVIQLQEEITSNVNVNRMLTFENENLKQQLEKLEIINNETKESFIQLNEKYIGINNSGINELANDFKTKMKMIEENNNSNINYLRNEINEVQNKYESSKLENEKLLSNLVEISGENNRYISQIEALTEEKNNLLDQIGFDFKPVKEIITTTFSSEEKEILETELDHIKHQQQKLRDEIEILYSVRDELQDENKKLRLATVSQDVNDIQLLQQFKNLYPELNERIGDVTDLQEQLSILYDIVTSQPVVHLRQFSEGKNILFKPTDLNKMLYEAVSNDGIKYFLHNEQYSEYRSLIESQKLIIGKIVFMEKMQTTHLINPYFLPQGTNYYLIFITKS